MTDERMVSEDELRRMAERHHYGRHSTVAEAAKCPQCQREDQDRSMARELIALRPEVERLGKEASARDVLLTQREDWIERSESANDELRTSLARQQAVAEADAALVEMVIEACARNGVAVVNAHGAMLGACRAARASAAGTNSPPASSVAELPADNTLRDDEAAAGSTEVRFLHRGPSPSAYPPPPASQTTGALLPCPWCGKVPDINHPATFQCTDTEKWGALICCGNGPDVRTEYGPVEEWRDKAIAAWNDRAARPSCTPLCEAARALADHLIDDAQRMLVDAPNSKLGGQLLVSLENRKLEKAYRSLRSIPQPSGEGPAGQGAGEGEDEAEELVVDWLRHNKMLSGPIHDGKRTQAIAISAEEREDLTQRIRAALQREGEVKK